MKIKIKISEKLFLIVLIIILFLFYAIFVRTTKQGGAILTWGLIAVSISLYIFYEYNRVKKAKREERRKYLDEHRQKLIENAVRKNKDGLPDDQPS
ncbi:MAG TPA: hypothetical protein VMI35_05175 [Puia sp.]|nr:hypothetical protein [Puia sp.]